MPLVDYARSKRPVFDIDLHAAPYDRWAEVGRRSKAKLGRFLRDIEAMAHDHVDHFVNASGWFPDSLKSISSSVLKPLAYGASRVTGRLAGPRLRHLQPLRRPRKTSPQEAQGLCRRLQPDPRPTGHPFRDHESDGLSACRRPGCDARSHVSSAGVMPDRRPAFAATSSMPRGHRARRYRRCRAPSSWYSVPPLYPSRQPAATPPRR